MPKNVIFVIDKSGSMTGRKNPAGRFPGPYDQQHGTMVPWVGVSWVKSGPKHKL